MVRVRVRVGGIAEVIWSDRKVSRLFSDMSNETSERLLNYFRLLR